ncbi:hypothetical protein EYF80_044711 [Liparis tanakae]|uniref:Uncharacterized protein n=1 Tax=Liparis tanakae TaxID=230148 RepID=A0A4Z2FV06_9TELE|nr:hypothetical protein EYF80_044711 [Liparis tanakae]
MTDGMRGSAPIEPRGRTRVLWLRRGIDIPTNFARRPSPGTQKRHAPAFFFFFSALLWGKLDRIVLGNRERRSGDPDDGRVFYRLEGTTHTPAERPRDHASSLLDGLALLPLKYRVQIKIKTDGRARERRSIDPGSTALHNHRMV